MEREGIAAKEMRLNLVYITTRDKEEARKIGKELVESRLAACINIIDNMNSMYWWEGKVQDDSESILIAKTKESLVPELIDKVKSRHSYECPCIVSLPLLEGNKEYLEWVEKETK
jgi:periplasmic divalent cation tolerance protein